MLCDSLGSHTTCLGISAKSGVAWDSALHLHSVPQYGTRPMCPAAASKQLRLARGILCRAAGPLTWRRMASSDRFTAIWDIAP